MRPILLILVVLPILIPFKSQILAKNPNPNDENSLHDGNDSENAPNSLKLSPSDSQEPAKKTNLELIDKMQKRQVGIIYRDDQPVGILQPFKRSYRFIPVREELLEGNEEETQDNAILHKRDLKTDNVDKTNTNKHQKDNEKFGDKLKNILDDMGLIENGGAANAKREMKQPKPDNKAQLPVNAKDNENRNKRNEHYLTKNEVQNKHEKSNIVDLNENYDGGGGGGGGGSDDDDDEKRIERQIRNKIKSLKDQVEREIEAMKEQQDPEDWKRKKRHIEKNLIDSENDNIDPIKQADVNLNPLNRRRRNTDDNTIDSGISNKEPGRIKRRIDEEVQDRPQQLSDLSDSDLFGALPRDFDGELSRYKRVKRTELRRVLKQLKQQPVFINHEV